MNPVDQSDETAKARQRKRSVALAWILGLLVLIFYALTIVKMGPSIINRPL